MKHISATPPPPPFEARPKYSQGKSLLTAWKSLKQTLKPQPMRKIRNAVIQETQLELTLIDNMVQSQYLGCSRKINR